MIVRPVQIENKDTGELTWVNVRIPYHCALSNMEDDMTKHYCDICGKQLDGGTSYRLSYKYICHVDNISEYHSGNKEKDLCADCFNTFEKTWNDERNVLSDESTEM